MPGLTGVKEPQCDPTQNAPGVRPSGRGPRDHDEHDDRSFRRRRDPATAPRHAPRLLAWI